MSTKHRKSEGRLSKIAVVSVAAATATALTIGAAPPPPKPAPMPVVVNQNVDLAAAYRPFTDPNQIPDLTGGLGNEAYDYAQQIGDMLLRALVGHLNLAALEGQLGPDSGVGTRVNASGINLNLGAIASRAAELVTEGRFRGVPIVQGRDVSHLGDEAGRNG